MIQFDQNLADAIPSAVVVEHYPDDEIKGYMAIPSKMNMEVWPLMLSHGGYIEILEY